MTSRSSLRKGWCPGALRPMQSGDGLILRVRPRVGTLRLADLLTIAKVAAEFGSGEIDLTNRGNLQLRGLTTASHSQALVTLSETGLIDPDEGAEAIRNIIVDPLSGVDPARADVQPLAAALEEILLTNSMFWQLPAKFGWSFSGTRDARVGDRATDIMVSSIAPDTYAVFLDGAAEIGVRLPSNHVVEAVTRLAAVFLELRIRDQSISRMKDAVARSGSATIYTAAGLESEMLPAVAPDSLPVPPVGAHKHSGQIFAVGVGLPFGRIDAHQLQDLCAASQARAGVVRMSPQRVLVFPVADDTRRHEVLTEAERLGLITEPDDPRLFFDVCPGSHGCANATTDTRQDARRLADRLRSQALLPSVHVSGCEKGCARRGAAALTLVARDGRYDLICDDGPAGRVALAAISPADIESAVARYLIEHAR